MNIQNQQPEASKTNDYSGIRLSDVDLPKSYAAAGRIINEIEKTVIGKRREITLTVTALLAGVHVLIEDVPGVGKTTLASALAAAAGLDFRRAQFTPDITASDITGFNIYNRSNEQFEFTPGLVMTNILLADEINRASPKTQSALLEAMADGKVTVDGQTYVLPDPFFVVATQNPSGFVGTFPLPEAQLDRFGIRISMGYPSPDEEIKIVENYGNMSSIEKINTVSTSSMIKFLRALTSDVHIDHQICSYIVSLVCATREHSLIELGASPRASLALKRLCQAYAFINGRSYVIPEDAAALFKAVTAHRITVTREARIRKLTPEAVLEDILAHTPIPYKGTH